MGELFNQIIEYIKADFMSIFSKDGLYMGYIITIMMSQYILLRIENNKPRLLLHISLTIISIISSIIGLRYFSSTMWTFKLAHIGYIVVNIIIFFLLLLLRNKLEELEEETKEYEEMKNDLK